MKKFLLTAAVFVIFSLLAPAAAVYFSDMRGVFSGIFAALGRR